MTPKCLRPMNRTNEHAQDVPLFRPIWKRDNNEIVAFFGCLSFWENLTKVPAGPGIKCSDKKFRLLVFPAVGQVEVQWTFIFDSRFISATITIDCSQWPVSCGRYFIFFHPAGIQVSVAPPCGLPRKARKRDGRPPSNTAKWRRWDKLDICFHVASLSHRLAPFSAPSETRRTHQNEWKCLRISATVIDRPGLDTGP